jgi:biopolymer transport protein ExbD
LRTRFTPRARISQGLIGVAPWVNILLLMLMFVLFQGRMVLRPGVVMHLPEVPFSAGTAGPVMVAVVVAVEPSGREVGGEAVFFDDVRYRVGNPEDMEDLKAALARRQSEHPAEALVLQADERVNHGTVMALINMASDVGIRTVNLASREGK